MKVPLNWISQYADIKLDLEQLVEKINTQIAPVEGVENMKERYEKILIGQIVEKADHPEADKLGVYQVEIGKEKVQVVAGDKTLEVGDKVAYFPPNTRIPYNAKKESENDVVTKVKLRGVESNGMLASARELDISNDHSHVMKLQTDFPAGSHFVQLFDLDDQILDIENKALTNRPDCFGIIGMAREFAGITQQPFHSPEWYLTPDRKSVSLPKKENLPLQIENQAGALCPRYMAVVMSGVQIAQSPIWLQSLLVKSGIRPINNIVDITNYLMLLTGQPLHAFDYDKVRQKDPAGEKSAHITVRTAAPGEKLTIIDGSTIELTDTTVIIADSSNPIGIGGIMGGLDTEISDESTNIIIECANFDMYNIRKSSMRHGIFTEAVTRYSKGQDPNQCESVLLKAIEMVSELAHGELAGDIKDHYEIKKLPSQVEVSLSEMSSHLGIDLKMEQVVKMLQNVELEVKKVDKDKLLVTAPTFRNDINIKQDIHEEVGRLYGYNSIDITLPKKDLAPAPVNYYMRTLAKVRKILTAAGADEVLTYSFVGSRMLELYGQNPELAFHLRNSLSPELEYMRVTLLPSLVSRVRQNHMNGYGQFMLFEVNKSHNKSELIDRHLPYERTSVAMVYSADDTHSQQNHSGSPYYQVKKYVETLLTQFNLTDLNYTLLEEVEAAKQPTWIKESYGSYNPKSSALLTVVVGDEEKIVGVLGEISERVKRAEKLPNFVAGAELDLNMIMELTENRSWYREPSRYPAVINDLCFVLDSQTSYSQVEEILKKELNSDQELAVSIEPVDIYASEKQIEEGKKQITFRVKLQHRSKTLSGHQVDQIVHSVVKSITKGFNATLKV